MKKRKLKPQGPTAKLNFLGQTSANMTFKDTQRKAVVLGMPFEDVVNADYCGLESFILRTNNRPDPSLLDKYDDWMDKHLESIGYDKNDPLRSYRLRLGYLGEDKEGNIKTKRVKGIPKPKKPKRERTANGLFAGTKKAYTFELTEKGLSFERIQRRVLKKFPDANPKSLKLWYSTAKRKLNKK